MSRSVRTGVYELAEEFCLDAGITFKKAHMELAQLVQRTIEDWLNDQVKPLEDL